MSKRTAIIIIIISAAGAVMALALILRTVTTAARHRTVTPLQHQTATQAAQISGQADRIKGTHQDLVTSGDLPRMGLQ